MNFLSRTCIIVLSLIVLVKSNAVPRACTEVEVVRDGPNGTISFHGGIAEVTCTWKVEAPEGETINLDFPDGFHLTDHIEFLEIYDGDAGGNAESTLAGSINKRYSYITTTNALFLVFTSLDGSGPGFEAQYTFSSSTNACPSFCSARGVCQRPILECECDLGYSGLGCELEAPTVDEVQLDESLGGFFVTFAGAAGPATDTDLAGLYGTFACSELMDTTGMGADPTCVWKTASTLHVRYGTGATIVPGDMVTFWEGKIGLFVESGVQNSFKMNRTSAPLILPANSVDPTILLQAPSLISSEYGFLVDSASGYGNGGRPWSHIEWDVRGEVRNEAGGPFSKRNNEGIAPPQCADSSDSGIVFCLDENTTVSDSDGNSVLGNLGSTALRKLRVRCRASNYLGGTSQWAEFEAVPDKEGTDRPFLASINAGQKLVVDHREPVYLETKIQLREAADRCVEADFEWTVEPDIPSLNGREKANLHVPPSYLFPGSQYKFSVNVSLNGTTQREFVVVDVMPLKPTGFIGGGSRQVPYDRKLDVTFIKTFDEHLLPSDANVTYEWTCSRKNFLSTTGWSPCYVNGDEFGTVNNSISDGCLIRQNRLPGDVIVGSGGVNDPADDGSLVKLCTTENFIEFPPKSLPPGEYRFVVEVDIGYSRRTRRDATIFLQRVPLPNVELRTNARSNVDVDLPDKHDPSAVLVLLSNVESSPDRSMQWTVLHGSDGRDNTPLDLSDPTVVLSVDNQQTDLVIARDILVPGEIVRFQLTVTEGENTAYAFVDVEVNRAPSPGLLIVSGEEDDWKTPFTATVKLAYDDLEDSPLSYWFHIEQVNCDEDDCLRTPLGDVSVQPSIEFTAPPGEYRVLCYVFDRLGAFSTVVSEQNITITGDVCGSNAQDAIEHAIGQAEIALCVGKTRQARNYVNTALWISASRCVQDYLTTPELEEEISAFNPRFRSVLSRLRIENRLSRISLDVDIRSFATSLRNAAKLAGNDLLQDITGLRGIAADLLSVGGYRSDESAQVHLDTLATAYSAARDGQLLSVSGAIALDLSLTVSQTAEEIALAMASELPCETMPSGLGESNMSVLSGSLSEDALNSPIGSALASFATTAERGGLPPLFQLTGDIGVVSSCDSFAVVQYEGNPFAFAGDTDVVSGVGSFSIFEDGVKQALPEGVEILVYLERLQDGDALCVALDEVTGLWSEFGCERQPDEGGYIVCKCSHTTNFGALFNGGGSGGGGGATFDTDAVASDALENFLDNNDGGVIEGLVVDASEARDILGTSNVDDVGNIIVGSDLELSDLQQVLDSQAEVLQYVYDYVDDARKSLSAGSSSAGIPWTLIIVGYCLSAGVIVLAVVFILVVNYVRPVHDSVYGTNQRAKQQKRRRRARSMMAEESARSSMNVLGSEQSALRASEMEHSEDLVV